MRCLPRVVEAGAWIGGVIAGATSLLLWKVNTPMRPGSSPLPAAAAFVADRLTDEELNAHVEQIVDADLFRLSRTPSPIPYSSETQINMSGPIDRPSRPQLILAGIVGGPPWVALIDGIPGRTGSVVVRRGDTLSGLLIRDITRTQTIISAADTLWKLTLKRTWK
jgi:hypothetical protein